MRAKDVIFLLLLLLGLASTAFLLGRATKDCAGETIVERVDTLVIRDTIVSYKPISVTKRVVDTAYVYVPEVIVRNDTVWAVMEREQVAWEDSLARVYASGIQPKVDSVIHYREQMTITKEIPVKVQSRWGIGVQGGVGVGKDGLTPYVGVGVSYNLISW